MRNYLENCLATPVESFYYLTDVYFLYARAPILLRRTPALHVILPATIPHQGSLIEAAAAIVARLGGKSTASKAD